MPTDSCPWDLVIPNPLKSAIEKNHHRLSWSDLFYDNRLPDTSILERHDSACGIVEHRNTSCLHYRKAKDNTEVKDTDQEEFVAFITSHCYGNHFFLGVLLSHPTERPQYPTIITLDN